MSSSTLSRLLLVTALLASLALSAIPPMPVRAIAEFSDLAAGLPGLGAGAVAWGDYDADGDLDILLAGRTSDVGDIARVYRNDGGAFTDIGAGLPGVAYASAAWGDYDSDADLDILLTGYTGASLIARVYRNDGGAFTDIAAGLPGVERGAAAWGDYDNDGDLDILLTGSGGSQRVARVYRNDGGAFTDIGAGLLGVERGAAAWGDYDNDGDLDFLLTGYTGASLIARVYRNDGGAFTDIGAGLTGVYIGAAAWGDYDSDGDLDILLTGRTSDVGDITWVYRNDGGAFTDIGAGLPGFYLGAAAWGDYDNDGDPDILLTGSDGTQGVARVYRNDGGAFTDIAAGLPGVHTGAVAWGDYDSDGDLDILLTGVGLTELTSRIYRNNSTTANTPPNAPTGLTATYDRDQKTADLSWQAASDDHTPSSGLSYNLRLGTTPGGSDILAPMAASDGWRRLPAPGNAQQRLTTTLDLAGVTPDSTVYWSVQAVDTAFLGGPFAAEGRFETGYAGLALAKSDGLATQYATWDQHYTIVVTSTGTITATGVVVTDTLPAGMYPASLPAGAVQHPDGSLTWDLGDLPAEAVRTLQLTARTHSDVHGQVTNGVVATAGGLAPVTATDDTEIVALPATPTPTATAIPTPTATPSATAVPTAMATATPASAPTGTPVAGDLVLIGVVYVETPRSAGAVGRAAVQKPIAGAVVEAALCVPQTYSATTGADGRYELTIPASAADTCSEITLTVSAMGYQPLVQSFPIGDLRALPRVDLGLTSSWRRIWLLAVFG